MDTNINFPRHIAIIMDGNGRWARQRGLPRLAGHRQGVITLRKITEKCLELGVSYLTVYAFSAQNWSRPKNEVEGLMRIFRQYLAKEEARLNKLGVRIKTIGKTNKFPKPIRDRLSGIISSTKANNKLTLTIALNYGARQEIIDAVKRIAYRIKKNKLSIKGINEDVLSGFLDTAGMPDPDLLIRTSGELRISNFLLWQASYAEFYFTDKYWPDFSAKDLEEAVSDFAARVRRFGGV